MQDLQDESTGEAEHAATAATGASLDDKDAPLRDDIRLLGRLLGDTVRAQEGEAVYELVEAVRRNGIRFHRDADEQARDQLQAALRALSPEQAVKVIRAFSYFSHLANIAEDEHHIRRTRAHDIAGSPPRRGTVPNALARVIDGAGVTPQEVCSFFQDAFISPVLTAHPTEVRRKSTMRREMAIADLLTRRGRGGLTAGELRDLDDKLARAVLILWQTNMLRQQRLQVVDEVANGLTFFDYTFFRQLPHLYAAIEDELTARCGPDAEPVTLGDFLRIGSWIGGDRDGNPYVTADVMRETFALQAGRVLDFYISETDKLRDELSISELLQGVSGAVADMAARASGLTQEQAAHWQAEPYRLALSHILERLHATRDRLADAGALQDLAQSRGSDGDGDGAGLAYSTPHAFSDDLLVLQSSLNANGSARLTRGRMRHLLR
ncbi:MAG: phosphoenolpyruvate carboxylase, partial [Pseudomonadota bacterium]